MLFFQIYWLLSACTNVWNRSKDTLLHCTLFCLLCICMWIFYSQRIPHEMNKQEMERKHTTKKSIDRLDFGRLRLYFSRNFGTKSEKNMNEHVLQQFYGDCYWISTFFIRIEEAIRMDNDRKRIKVRKKSKRYLFKIYQTIDDIIAIDKANDGKINFYQRLNFSVYTSVLSTYLTNNCVYDYLIHFNLYI